MTRLRFTFATIFLLAAVTLSACGDSDGGNSADVLGVGAECTMDDECAQSNVDGGLSSSCLTQFKGGYCGIEDCTAQDDCPEGSACVMHDDGNNYCFRLCLNKDECNLNRSPDNESNCSSNIDFAGGADLGKACVPPSSGT